MQKNGGSVLRRGKKWGEYTASVTRSQRIVTPRVTRSWRIVTLSAHGARGLFQPQM